MDIKSKIAVVITNRTNYSKLKLVLKELKEVESIELQIIASSSILLEKYGTPYRDLEADGYTIGAKVDCLLMNDSHEAMVNTAGLSMIQHSSYFSSFRPDLLLIVGDRYDTLSPALCASMMNIPMAHIQGGETSGTIDNKVRDLISKISTLHFVATEKSKERLKSWGIEGDRIYNFGCPAVEYISSLDVGSTFDPNCLKKTFKRPIDIGPEEEYFLVLVHPDTTNENDLSMDIILNAIEYYQKKAFVFYPNVDANNSKIISHISKHRKNVLFYTIRHMPLEGFIHTMAHCCCMVGNSSAGIREAASFGVPVINIGKRQEDRERNLNVIDVHCDEETIIAAIKTAMTLNLENSNIYYKKRCSKKIAKEIVNFIENL